MLVPLLDVKASYLKWVERVGFAKVAKTIAGMGHVFCINPADTLRGQGADFLKWVAFWSCRFSGLPRRFSVMGGDGAEKKHEAASSALNFPFLKKSRRILRLSSSRLESRQRRTKGSVVGEEWCQNAAPLRWYTKNVFAQSKMILSRAWLHDTVSCAAWNDARKGVYLKPLFKTLAATVIEAEAYQLCWTTGTSPSWKVCL